ncbi:MAG: NAD(P)/FAD-dependent oxidoreductase, partial [Mobilitalea sp.]
SIIIDFLPDMIKEKTKELLMKRINQQTNMNLEEMMVGLFNNKLAYVLLKQAKLDTSKKSIQLSNQEIDSLVEQIKEFHMIITDTNSFENAQVSAGGVSTKEIEETTMESKLSPNLYITGELIDVDGTCGGYNLQWAWSTGYLAGSSIHNK